MTKNKRSDLTGRRARIFGCFFLFVEQICKPGSVFDDYLSRPCITVWLKPPPNTGTPGRLSLCKPIRCCFGWGLHGRCVAAAPVSSYLAFPPLPAQIAINAVRIKSAVQAVCFCCTVLRVASTGSYPAPLPCEARTFLVRIKFSRNHLTYSTYLLYHFFRELSNKTQN